MTNVYGKDMCCETFSSQIESYLHLHFAESATKSGSTGLIVGIIVAVVVIICAGIVFK